MLSLKLEEPNFGSIYNPYANFSVKIVSAENEVYPLEAPTAGYTLFGAGLGFDFVLSKATASVDFSVSNIGDLKYTDPLSRYRYYALAPGRSFNLKFTVPFQF